MKKMMIVMAAAAMMMFGAGSVFAAASGTTSLNSGAFGFSVGVGNSVFGDGALGGSDVVTINGRYFVMNDLAIVGGFGARTSSGDYDSDYYQVSGGVRKYFKTDQFAPFVQGMFTYAKQKTSLPGTGPLEESGFDISAVFGAEYFLQKQFSIEGAVGLGFGTVDVKGNPDTDYTYFGTRTVGLSANFYF